MSSHGSCRFLGRVGDQLGERHSIAGDLTQREKTKSRSKNPAVSITGLHSLVVYATKAEFELNNAGKTSFILHVKR